MDWMGFCYFCEESVVIAVASKTPLHFLLEFLKGENDINSGKYLAVSDFFCNFVSFLGQTLRVVGSKQ